MTERERNYLTMQSHSILLQHLATTLSIVMREHKISLMTENTTTDNSRAACFLLEINGKAKTHSNLSP